MQAFQNAVESTQVTTPNGLWIREAPSMSSRKLGVLDSGYEVDADEVHAPTAHPPSARSFIASLVTLFFRDLLVHARVPRAGAAGPRPAAARTMPQHSG